MSQKTPRNFFKPLAIGAPDPMRELPVRLERMIHFVPPHLEKVRAKVPQMADQADVVLANLEDAIPADAKDAARDGAIEGLLEPRQSAELALVSGRCVASGAGGR